MTSSSAVLLAVAAAFAVADWVAVRYRAKTVEYVCKPATLAALIGVALALDPVFDPRRWWFVGALAFSLAGDVFLMLPNRAQRVGPPRRDPFVLGLAAFLVAHLAYIAGLRVGERSLAALVVAALLVFVVATPVGLRIVRGARATSPRLATPVAAYVAVISVMAASALATRDPVATAGAGLFVVSDAVLGWNRFVLPMPWAPLAVIVTYHVGQALLVLSLV